MKGYVQVYTGNGKGKTTAAIGLAIRAMGAGKNVFIGQFVKGMRYSEIEALEKFENIVVAQYGLECFITGAPKQEDIDIARAGLRKMKEIVLSGDYDVVIFDEANIAIYFNLYSVEELLEIIEQKPEHVEIIITGRLAKQELIERADLVTEMKEVKHYYNVGVEARKGIES